MATQGAGGPTTQPQGGSTTPPPGGPTASRASTNRGDNPAIDSVNNGLQVLTAKLASLAATVVATQVAMMSTSKTTAALAGQTNSQLKKLTEASINSITSELAALESASTTAARVIDESTAATRVKTKAVDAEIAGIFQKARADVEATAAAKAAVNTLTKAKEAEAIASGKSFAMLKSSILSIESEQKRAREALANSAAALAKLEEEYNSATVRTKKLDDQITQAGKTLEGHRKTVEEVDIRYNAHGVALGKHVNVMDVVTTKLLGFSAALSFAQNASKLYDEANEAKKTGNYGSSWEFMLGQVRAGVLGVSSKVYNELNAQTRGSALTDAGGQGSFDRKLWSATNKMTEMAGNREEGAKLAAHTFEATATVGVSSKIASERMDELADGFNRLSKITGKTVGEMAELTFAITKDVDHRAIMLGMAPEERANYMLKQQQDLVDLKLQGYSIEQGQALQKIAMQQRTDTLAARVHKQASAQQTMYTMASQVGGKTGQEMQSIAQRRQAVDQELMNKQHTTEERDKLRKDRAVLDAEFQAKYEQAGASGELTGLQEAQLEEQNAKLKSSTGVTAAQSAMEKPNAAKIKEKSEEKAQGSDIVSKTVDTAAGYASALSHNTMALVALSGVMTAFMFFKGGGKLSLGGAAEIKDAISKHFNFGKQASTAGKASEFIGPLKPTAAEMVGPAKPTLGQNLSKIKAAAPAVGAEALQDLKGGAVTRNLSKLGKIPGVKSLGMIGTVIGVASAASDISDISKEVKAGELTEKQGTVKKAGVVGSAVGSMAGAAAGAGLGMWGGAAAGAAIGSAVPVVGTVIGGLVGLAIGAAAAYGGSKLGEIASEKIAEVVTSDKTEGAIKQVAEPLALTAKVKGGLPVSPVPPSSALIMGIESANSQAQTGNLAPISTWGGTASKPDRDFDPLSTSIYLKPNKTAGIAPSGGGFGIASKLDRDFDPLSTSIYLKPNKTADLNKGISEPSPAASPPIAAQTSIEALQRTFYQKGIAFFDASDPSASHDMRQKYLNVLRYTATNTALSSSAFSQAPVTQGA